MTDHLPEKQNASEVLFYQTEDGQSRISVRLDGDTAWMTQADMANLFQTTPQNITIHIRGIYEDEELLEEATCKEYLQVRSEGERTVQRQLKHYNLEMILAVGYRVRSHRGTQFRRWATERLREYLVKGFTMDDERLRRAATLGPIISTSFWSASATSAPARTASTPRSGTFTNSPPTMTPMPKKPVSSSRSSRTNCTGPSPAIRRPKSSTPAPMRPSPTWA
jgi:hypothetical protein